jgi:DNA repair protein RecN (Recombination protein N)
LGFGTAVFYVKLIAKARKCTDASAYSSSALSPGLDAVEFFLLHSKDGSGGNDGRRGGQVNEVASSGEKARILLAVECALPGAVGATCFKTGTLLNDDNFLNSDLLFPPIAVLYDEIDAHVGGRAAVSMAQMLAAQSHSSQILTITHSPSIAAVADAHVVMHKSTEQSDRGRSFVRATIIDDAGRRKELARMASGDLCAEEAEKFAEALIRDGLESRKAATR